MAVSKQELSVLQDKVRTLLWRDWDPICLKDDPDAPKDEYDQYVLTVTGMLVNGQSVDSIAEFLNEAAGMTMGMPVPMSVNLAVAADLDKFR